MTSIAMLVPSKGRPSSVVQMAEAWEHTSGPADADLIWLIDRDDPGWARYMRMLARYPWMKVMVFDQWMPMVHKLNWAAVEIAPKYDILGFMGDDHLPRSPGWGSVLAAGHTLHGHGIWYGRDGIRDMKLPTWWAMSAKAVEALGAMVPAPVEHMYCDNVMLELGKAARVLRYLPSILIEHMHPVAEKAEWDEGYRHVNRPEQYERDRAAFVTWLSTDRVRHATILRELARGV